MEVSQSPDATLSDVQGRIPCLFPASEIAGRVRELGEQISADYAGKPLLMVGVLHGAFVFMSGAGTSLSGPMNSRISAV